MFFSQPKAYFLRGEGGFNFGKHGESLSVMSGQHMNCSLSTGCVIDEETDYLGHDIDELKKAGKPFTVKNQQACATMTGTKEGALFWTYRASDKKCWIKTSKKGKKAHKGLVSGSIGCAIKETEE